MPFSFFPSSLSNIASLFEFINNSSFYMEKEYIEEQEYLKIVDNQKSIISALDDEGAKLRKILDYSEKSINESKDNFERGVQTIGRIRKNLDDIHSALRDIQKIGDIKVSIKDE